MKTAELNDLLLNYWVAKAIGHDPVIGSLTLTIEPICLIRDWNRPGTLVNGKRFEPHKDWAHGGPIIDREKISTVFEPWLDHPKEWQAVLDFSGDESGGYTGKFIQYGQTALIAAMRTFVASRFGEEVPDLEQPGA